MVDASPLAMFTVDSQGRVNSWNAAAERLLGWTRKEVLGAPPPVRIADAGPNRSNVALSFRDHSGQEIGAAAWSVPLREDSGGKRGHLTVLVPLADLRDVGPGLLTASGQ
jgi:PAS domain S-box-containing protein